MGFPPTNCCSASVTGALLSHQVPVFLQEVPAHNTIKTPEFESLLEAPESSPGGHCRGTDQSSPDSGGHPEEVPGPLSCCVLLVANAAICLGLGAKFYSWKKSCKVQGHGADHLLGSNGFRAGLHTGGSSSSDVIPGPPGTPGTPEEGASLRGSAPGKTSSQPAAVFPLRYLGQGYGIMYVPSTTTDVFNWQSQLAPFSKDPQAIYNLIRNIINTQTLIWMICNNC
ncbi:uncharacterized protein LOC104865205 [Fukomys damarensis]|uniref:uncharacterized protein LOC104865205 n=1 Tax=Fukomys damarensis TaxID=885580 RepID=UPI00053FB0A4|nr:uncharacterized protein LOC104865205 [Fukomys damarensis]